MATAEYAPAVLRTRPVATGHWRAFLAVARHLNFRAAADELALTQSAVSRQIQALEEEVGVALFLRHTRAVELTSAGAQLQRAVAPALERMDAAVRQVRQTAGRAQAESHLAHLELVRQTAHQIADGLEQGQGNALALLDECLEQVDGLHLRVTGCTGSLERIERGSSGARGAVRKRILVVDDSPIARKMLIKALPPDWDIEITQASNGIEALAAYRAGRVDVMFLDLTMPDMDGYQVLETLRKEDLNCLVIVVSADVQEKAQERVLAMGAIAFIRKPITAEGLRDVLKQYGVVV